MRIFSPMKLVLFVRLLLAIGLGAVASRSGGQQQSDGKAQNNLRLADYEGVYDYHGGTTLMIVAADREVFAVIDEAKYPLRAIGAGFLNAAGDTIPFRRAAGGAVSGFVERAVFFPRRTSTIDPVVAADVRAAPRPLGKSGHVDPYRYALPPDIGDGLQVGAAENAGFDTVSLANVVRNIANRTYPDVHGILVYRTGKLVFEEYFYGYNRDRPHQMRSATKSVVSTLVGIAVDRGALTGEGERVMNRLPYANFANPDPRKDALTLRDLLTMQSGLACDDWNEASPGNESRVYQSADWVKFVLDLPMTTQPGTHGSYCSGNVAVAGRIVERATGQSLPAFAQENLFAPLGIRASDVRWNYTLSSSNASTFAQLYLRPRDMLKLGILVLQQGSWKGRQVISREWVARSTGLWSTVGDQKYGYFWWHQWVTAASPSGPRRVDMIVATGNGGQKIYIVPSVDLIVVLTGGNYNTQSPAMTIMSNDLLPALLNN
jgi:CubicO group peptidase (beta-lactamase class C family)